MKGLLEVKNKIEEIRFDEEFTEIEQKKLTKIYNTICKMSKKINERFYDNYCEERGLE